MRLTQNAWRCDIWKQLGKQHWIPSKDCSQPGAVAACQSCTQSICSVNAAVNAIKHLFSMNSSSRRLSLHWPVNEGNEAAIKNLKHSWPTDRICPMEIKRFALQHFCHVINLVDTTTEALWWPGFSTVDMHHISRGIVADWALLPSLPSVQPQKHKVSPCSNFVSEPCMQLFVCLWIQHQLWQRSWKALSTKWFCWSACLPWI